MPPLPHGLTRIGLVSGPDGAGGGIPA